MRRILFAAIAYCSILSLQAQTKWQRPAEIWAFRSVLDGEPRMLTLLLHQALTVAYDTENCTLYKAWQGKVELQGAVYNTKHGPQPYTVGRDYFKNAERLNAWYVKTEATAKPTKVKFEGYTFRNNQIELKYRVYIDSARYCHVYELPEYIERSGQPGIVRYFRGENIPSSTQIILNTYAAGYRNKEDFTVTGNWQTLYRTEFFQEGSTHKAEAGQLILTNASPTATWTVFFTNQPNN